ncbi:MAG: hypothetical protein M0Z50_04715 [Planctomycetia bacterium]|nr:hypothetical protein [Planctomycetia bacterium]
MAVRMLEDGLLPQPGGWLDQDFGLWQAMMFFRAELHSYGKES